MSAIINWEDYSDCFEEAKVMISMEKEFLENYCSGPKHCSGRKYNKADRECYDCIQDMYNALNDVFKD